MGGWRYTFPRLGGAGVTPSPDYGGLALHLPRIMGGWRYTSPGLWGAGVTCPLDYGGLALHLPRFMGGRITGVMSFGGTLVYVGLDE